VLEYIPEQVGFTDEVLTQMRDSGMPPDKDTFFHAVKAWSHAGEYHRICSLPDWLWRTMQKPSAKLCGLAIEKVLQDPTPGTVVKAEKMMQELCELRHEDPPQGISLMLLHRAMPSGEWDCADRMWENIYSTVTLDEALELANEAVNCGQVERAQRWRQMLDAL
ncbi:hypothetical protein CYMTET_20218, partial [Cymbomonas tetramitiformis]